MIANYDWPVRHCQPDVIDSLIEALNRADIEAILSLYQPNAILVTPLHTLQGREALRAYYTDLLTKELPGATFIAETRVNEGYIRHIRWDALSARNGTAVQDGQDTIALRQGLIQYHTSVYRVV